MKTSMSSLNLMKFNSDMFLNWCSFWRTGYFCCFKFHKIYSFSERFTIERNLKNLNFSY